MPAPRKEHARVLPPEGSDKWPAYKVNFSDGRPPIYRYIVQRPGVAPETVNAPSLAAAKRMRARSESTLEQHAQLTFERAIPLYMETFVKPASDNANSHRTKEGRLRNFFEPVLTMPVARLTPERAYTLYMGKVATKLGEDGKPVILEAGYIHRPTKKKRGVTPKVYDRSGRGTGLIDGRYEGTGQRHQVCHKCGQVGHNRRRHRPGEPEVELPVPTAEFLPPSVATHQATLSEAKKFMEWLAREGFAVVGKTGQHPLEHVQPFGRKTDGGFGKSKLTDPELVLLDRTSLSILGTLPLLPEEVRLPWHQRAVAMLLLIRCGARTGELIKARCRQFTIVRKPCADMTPPCSEDHGGHTAGVLQVVRESAKTGTSVRDLPIAPSLMAHVLPLLEGKPLEHFFLAGAPRGGEGFGIGGANWERDGRFGFSARWLANSVARLCEIAGVRRANPHSFRGSYVDNRVGRGDVFAEVSRDTGHGKTKTTLRHYANAAVIAESEQRRMRERLGYGDGQTDGRN